MRRVGGEPAFAELHHVAGEFAEELAFLDFTVELQAIAMPLGGDRPVIEKILTHLGLDPQPPPSRPAREPMEHQAG